MPLRRRQLQFQANRRVCHKNFLQPPVPHSLGTRYHHISCICHLTLVSAFPHYIHLNKSSISSPTFCICTISLDSNHVRTLGIAIYWHEGPDRRQPTVVGLLAYKETLVSTRWAFVGLGPLSLWYYSSLKFYTYDWILLRLRYIQSLPIWDVATTPWDHTEVGRLSRISQLDPVVHTLRRLLPSPSVLLCFILTYDMIFYWPIFA